MVPVHIPKTYYDKYGQNGFDNWIFAVLKRVYGSDNFVPSPVRGADGGSDAEYVRASEIPFIVQIKWREVGTYDMSKLRSSITATFRKEVKKILEREQEVKYLFITNVPLTKDGQDNFKKIVNDNPTLHIEYWSFEGLNIYLREFDDLNDIHCPYYTKDEVEKIKTEALKSKQSVEKRYARKVSITEFKDIQYRIKDLFVDSELQKKFYYGFIYFLQPFYLDKRGLSDRSILRQLLDISEEEEDKFLKDLIASSKVQVIGELASVIDIDLAKVILNEMIDSIKIPLERVVDLFIKKV